MILSILFWRSKKYSEGLNTKWNNEAIFILTGTLAFVICLFEIGFQEDKLIIHSDKIELDGSYGEAVILTDNESIKLVDNLPKITMKKNGFALGNINKGYFGRMKSQGKRYIFRRKRSLRRIFLRK